ncbi:UDP-GlcNAc:betaGal beta-1,3-N-acetylglucosaminyltransferase-like protein 1 [Homarus americanus]|uniref:UDP-GlcNAc:betaGal beta-1,3-N-acetylglucosaminyltransferase-like protein 1 n=1 Tax=Homarus americanus TaxID=6706 RepID=UPI001C47F7B5|nr:UDP-GlcNAc:betaGal beta-1,3-N-acetylglucosaminyltransferase-like protein 1 [Homarus americanus]XP_042207051.1 UDP-GlcNAc:betaGal beta-1,3-N-acetylglucosaminyltransferase-like protein 1 [Homarus americanus]
MNLDNIDVSVIIPVHNGAVWLGECLASVLRQQHTLTVEVSVFLDSCKDTSEDIVQGWAVKLEDQGYVITVGKENNDKPKGVGYAKNKAVEQSHGEFLCFLDSDDVMLPTRLQRQYDLAFHSCNAIVGSRFSRDPPDSTVRYTKWANGLTAEQLTLQIYTSHGPTVIMPTWFIHHTVFERVGGFSDAGAGTPEDLIFFFTHLKRGGRVVRHDEELLIYRYHPQATTFSIHEQTIWDLRVRVIQDEVLSSWPSFTIWNAGKQGRKFYRSLTTDNQKKVMAFCDVDVKKIGSFYTYEESQEKPKPRIPMIHFKEAKPPLIICMKMELTDGVFEENLASLQLKEGTDYFHFN